MCFLQELFVKVPGKATCKHCRMVFRISVADVGETDNIIITNLPSRILKDDNVVLKSLYKSKITYFIVLPYESYFSLDV